MAKYAESDKAYGKLPRKKKKKLPKGQAKKKQDTKIAQLKEIGPGVLASPNMQKELKRLGIDPADLLKIKSSGIKGSSNQFGPVKL